MHTASNITASARVKEFGSANFHSSDGVLFCTPCNKAINHLRRSTITDHLKSLKHEQLSKKRDDSPCPPKRQCTVSAAFKEQSAAKQKRDNVSHDFVKMLLAANIPLQKADDPAVRDFLMNHVNGGGAIPGACQLRSKYLPTIFEEHNSHLRDMFSKESSIAIIVDETCDFQNRPLMNILFQRLLTIDDANDTEVDLLPPILVQSVFIEKANHSTVSEAVIQCCADYQIDLAKVFLFVSDSASYMVKAWETVLSSVFRNGTHLHCLAHIAALAGNSWRMCLKDIDKLVSLMKSVLSKAPSRRNRFLRHLRSCGVAEPTLPPEPVITRWNTWFQAVRYHATYAEYYLEFVEKERREEIGTVALDKLIEVLQSPSLVQRLNYTAEKCSPLMAVIDRWQSRKLQIHLVYNDQYDLMSTLASFYQLDPDNDEDLTVGPKSAHEKLCQYTTVKKQPAINLLRDIRCLDPVQLSTINMDYASIKTSLFLPDACDDEWPVYVALAREVPSSSGIVTFWKAVRSRLPNLSSSAVLRLQLPVNSADVERSFSSLRNLDTCRRQNLKDGNLKDMLKVIFNQF